MIGLYGKIPSHGDFVRRNLPDTFLMPWDQWLQDCLAHTQDALGEAFDDVWDEARAWRFRIGPGTCGPAAAQGILLPSSDWVGRRFPLTAARLSDGVGADLPAAWFEALAARLGDAVARGERADELAASLAAFDDTPAGDAGEAPSEGWWQDAAEVPVASGLPGPDVFLSMVARSR